MKKILIAITCLFILSGVAKSQDVIWMNQTGTSTTTGDTIANDMVKTGIAYLNPGDRYIVDSVTFVVYAYGEVNLDQFTYQKGLYTPDGLVSYYAQEVGDSTTLTIDLAQTTAGVVTECNTLPKSKMHGVNYVKVTITAGASGCANDDTGQGVWMYAMVYRRYK